MPTIERVQHVVSNAHHLFGGDPYLRIVHYAREATLDAAENPKLSPRNITPFLVGHAGYGKTSRIRQYARDQEIGYRERKLSGIVDIAEVFGMFKTIEVKKGLDEQGEEVIEGRTIFCPPGWWPDFEKEPEGVIVFDDVTRAHNHIIQAAMQLAIDGFFNDLFLPPGWTVIFTGNPEEGYSGVTGMDDAFWSRLLVIGYNRPNEIFYEQMELQEVHPKLKNLWMKQTELVTAPHCEVRKPKDNDRLKMIFARIFDYVESDPIAKQIVATSMFGSGFLTMLTQMESEDQPFEPDDVLNNFEGIRSKLHAYTENYRTDVLSLTIMRLTTHMSAKGPKVFSKEQMTNVSNFGLLLSDNHFSMLIHRLMNLQKGDASAWSAAFQSVCETQNNNGPFFSRYMKARTEIQQKLSAMLA